MTQLSVVIPTFNERRNMEILLADWATVLAERPEAVEIIIVDDDSPDGTAEAAAAFQDRIAGLRVERRRERRGIASAWVDGCELATGAYLSFMDGDLCHDPRDLLRLYDECRHRGVDMVIGSRYLPEAAGMTEKSFVAILASRMAQIALRIVLGLEISDATHSFRVFRREVMARVGGRLRSGGNVWLAELSVWTLREGFRITEIPITYGKRIHGETKLGLGREGLRFLYRFLMLRLSR
jgi:dolichol-phosphate mannosyltransferase